MDIEQPLSRRALLTGAGAVGAGAILLGVLPETSGAATVPRRRATPAIATSGFSTASVGAQSNARLTMTVGGGVRTMRTTSLPAHAIDPDFSYPAPPAAQDMTFRVTTRPRLADQLTELVTGYTLGVHLDSVTLETASADYYDNDFMGPWNYVPRPLDRYGAHTHPVGTNPEDGDYHYHRVTAEWTSDPSRHSPVVGWAADGFPVYLRYGYATPTSPGRIANLTSSFRIRQGSRPSTTGSPGGTYDGTFVADYEYVEGLGDLDECNGRLCVTPEFPSGIYAYFLTDGWPSIPHWLRGVPDGTFTPQNNGSQGPPTGGPPGTGGGPPPR